MKTYYGLNKLKELKPPVVVLGVFDGVHKGHILILRAAAKKARQTKTKSIVVTFDPHPQKEESLYSLEHRLKLIAGSGIDICAVIRFNERFARITANNFIKDILLKKLKPGYIFVGENFTFGAGAKGNIALLKTFSGEYNFKLKVFRVLKKKGRVISSTQIRRFIKAGKFSLAESLLSRPVSILGTVIKGASVARQLGVPTANIDPHHEVLPPSGVYLVKVNYNKKKHFGVCSIGNKPTFGINKIQHIEVHILNFDKNIYKEFLEIEFIKLLRKQKKFSSREALVAQIKKDIISAKRLISSH